jgi:hypothetical protein
MSTYTREQLESAKSTLRRAAMVAYGGDLLGTALVSVEVSDSDAVKLLDNDANGVTFKLEDYL